MATVPCIGDDRGIPSFRVLVVEDYEEFRRFLCSVLNKRTEPQVIYEVSDGLEAVRKAEELHPDLILLDVGLPTLNGLEAARQIRKLCPQSKILFVSQESSAEVVQEALRLGAGYVAKTHAGGDLSAAVEAVCQGGRFVSAGLAFHDPADLSDLRATNSHLYPHGVSPSIPEAGD